jgi:type IV pilus assembly protein PilC
MAPELKTFEYQARDTQGKVVKGRIEAPTQSAVSGRLRSMGVAPMAVKEVSTGGLNMEIHLGGTRVKQKDLAVMARQLATMVSAGLSLLRALSILAEQTESQTLAKVLGQVRNDVETGQSLSAALEQHPAVFPPLMINMVKAGEVGGFLEEVLLSVANNFEAEVKLRAKIKSAMTYPVVVFCIAIQAILDLVRFVVPVFAKMFSDLGGHLPLPTRILVQISGVVKVGALPVAVIAIVFTFWWRRHKNDRGVRELLDPLKLRTPVFGQLFRKVAISRFTRNFGTMIRSGVPLLQALAIVGDTSGNMVISRAVTEVQESVRQGQTLTAPLAKHPVFPPMVVQMMAVGEDSGSLDTMLAKVSEFYDQEVEATTEALTSLIEPLMIAILGALVGSMVIALYMPIFSIFNLIQ